MSVGKNMQACFMLYVHCMAELLYIDWRYEYMIKVIASDMDGTLLCDDHRIAPDTIAAVKEACAAGIRFMVATGRGYEGAMAELDGTGIVCDYILGSGAEDDLFPGHIYMKKLHLRYNTFFDFFFRSDTVIAFICKKYDRYRKFFHLFADLSAQLHSDAAFFYI